MKNVAKEAAKDAAEYAASQMSYGEGAGTRRKLIASAVAYKTERISGYHEAFNRAYDSQDITKHIKSAKRSRVTKDVGAVTGRNIRAIARGDKHGMSTPIIIAVVGITIAHKTGYDRKAAQYLNHKTTQIRAWLKRKL